MPSTVASYTHHMHICMYSMYTHDIRAPVPDSRVLSCPTADAIPCMAFPSLGI